MKLSKLIPITLAILAALATMPHAQASAAPTHCVTTDGTIQLKSPLRAVIPRPVDTGIRLYNGEALSIATTERIRIRFDSFKPFSLNGEPEDVRNHSYTDPGNHDTSDEIQGPAPVLVTMMQMTGGEDIQIQYTIWGPGC